MGKSSTNTTLLISLEILHLMPRVGSISAQDIQQQLEEAGYSRNIRSIQRLLNDLASNDLISVDTSQSPYSYRASPRGKSLAPTKLTESEALLLHLCEEYVKDILPKGLQKTYQGLFEQAHHALAPQMKDSRAQQWPDKVKLIPASYPLLPPEIDETVFTKVSKALYDNHKLQVSYNSLSKGLREYRVSPLGLAQQGSNFYLVAVFDGYDEPRTLALHRMQDAHIIPETVNRPEGFSLKRYNDEGRFNFGRGEKVKVEFTVTRKSGYFLYETPFADDQEIIKDGDNLIVSGTVYQSTLFRRWVDGFGVKLITYRIIEKGA